MAYYHVTVSGGGGDSSGDSWANAMSFSDFETSYEGSPSAGDVYYIKDGTYTLTSAIIGGGNGTTTSAIFLIGVKTDTENEDENVAESDWATGDDRPVFSGTNYFQTGTYTIIIGLRFELSGGFSIKLSNQSMAYNCSAINTSGTAGRSAWDLNVYCKAINCEGKSTNGRAFYLNSSVVCLFCYAHDSNNGFYLNTDIGIILFCIADTCTTAGINLTDEYYHILLNNTIYNCGTGILGATNPPYGMIAVNQIINDCTTGINLGAATDVMLFLNNNLEGNTTDWAAGDEPAIVNIGETSNNPQFTDDSGGDFSLGSASDCIDAGKSIEAGVG